MITARLAIFDLDDTLIATRDAVLIARETVLREHLKLTSPADLGFAQEGWQRLTWYYSADDRVSIFAALCRALGRPEPARSERTVIAERYEEVMIANVALSPGAERTLDSLQEQGVLLGIVSAGTKTRQQQKISHTRLGRWVRDEYIVVDEPGSPNAKPHPTSFLQVCTVAGVSPSDAVTIGDRVADTIAGNLAGCHSVFYYGRPLEVRLPGPPGLLNIELPELSIRALEDLLRHVAGPTRKPATPLEGNVPPTL